MAFVKFQSSAFIGGRRFQKGLQEVPEELLDILPSSAVVIDEREAASIRAKMEAEAEAARRPQTLKDMRAGRLKPAAPMGKEPAKPLDGGKAEPPRTDAAADLDALRERYTELAGKKPFGGWKEDQLNAKIAELEQSAA